MATADSLVADLQSWTNALNTLPSGVALECVNAAIRRMARRHNFRFQQASVDLELAGGTSGSAVLPADFLQEIFVYTKDATQTDPAKALIPIGKVQRPHWFGAVSPLGNTDPSFPQVAAPSSRTVVTSARGYFLWAGQLYIVPTPSALLTVTLDYVRTLPDLALGIGTGDQNPFTVVYPDVVRCGAFREAYRFLHQWDVAIGYGEAFLNDLKEAIDADNAVAFAGPSPARGK